MMSRMSTVAIPYQPWARHQYSGDLPVAGSAQVCARFSSYAWMNSPACGPVVACVVVLGDGFDTDGVDDSKRLTALQREALCARIRGKARAFSVGVADPREIDRLNILRATYVAMQRAVAGLAVAPDLLLVDALQVPGLAMRQQPIIKGDALSVSIAAASVVAKVERDAMMREYDVRYPGYGLGRNMGYAADDHREALRRLGPSEIHRRSFHGTERWLF